MNVLLLINTGNVNNNNNNNNNKKNKIHTHTCITKKQKVKEEGAELCEKLCIFGSLRSRRGAALKVMSAVEFKTPGQFVRGETLLECRRIPGDVTGICSCFILYCGRDCWCCCCLTYPLSLYHDLHTILIIFNLFKIS
jgi:hypothetical protein